MLYITNFSAVVQINWTVAGLLVTEGDVVRLSGEVFGRFAVPIEIGVVCKETFAVGIEKGMNIAPGNAICKLLA